MSKKITSYIDQLYSHLVSWPIKISCDILRDLPKMIDEEISNQNEDNANYLATLRLVLNVRYSFIYIFNLIKDKQSMKAWQKICDLQKTIDIIENLNDYNIHSSSDFHIDYIKYYINNLLKLFPNFHYTSRDVIIFEKECSICNQVVRIKGGCNHVENQIYFGKRCTHIWKDYEFRSWAIVDNPKDKYSVIVPTNSKYNFSNLEFFFDNLKSVYDEFTVSANIIYFFDGNKRKTFKIKKYPVWQKGFEPKTNFRGNLEAETILFKIEDLGMESIDTLEDELLKFFECNNGNL